MPKITVVCREEGYESNILIYAVDVKNPADAAEVQAEVQIQRNYDLGDVAGEIRGGIASRTVEILFAFAGDLSPSQDWRD